MTLDEFVEYYNKHRLPGDKFPIDVVKDYCNENPGSCTVEVIRGLPALCYIKEQFNFWLREIITKQKSESK